MAKLEGVRPTFAIYVVVSVTLRRGCRGFGDFFFDRVGAF